MNCGAESNDNNLHLDAHQIADMVFSDTLSQTDLSKLEFSSIDLKTYFEMGSPLSNSEVIFQLSTILAESIHFIYFSKFSGSPDPQPSEAPGVGHVLL